MNLPVNSEVIWRTLFALIRNPYGVAGVMGNLYAESGMNPRNLQNSFEKRLGMTDIQYTNAVDSGKYKDFATDGAGYGIAQWTFATRKQNLLAFAKAMGTSIGDIKTQVAFLALELHNYSYVLNQLRSALSVRSASDTFLYHFEKPASVSGGLSGPADKREEYSNAFYQEFKNIRPEYSEPAPTIRVLKRGSTGTDVAKLQRNLIALGYQLGSYGADGSYGAITENAVRQFQQDHGLAVDGKAGAMTQVISECIVTAKAVTHMCTVTISGLTETEALELKAKYPDAELLTNC